MNEFNYHQSFSGGSPNIAELQEKLKKQKSHTFAAIIAGVVVCLLVFAGAQAYISVEKVEAYNSGYTSGYSSGEKDGHASGKSEGYSEGKKDGYNSGYDEGKTKGEAEGEKTGYKKAAEEYENKMDILMKKLETKWPENGKVIFASTEDRYAPLTIENPTDVPYFFKMYSDDGETQKDVLQFFVRPQSTAEIYAPLGNYKIKYAYDVRYTPSLYIKPLDPSWYGDKMLFGDYSEAAAFTETFSFTVDSEYYHGFTLSMEMQIGGNLSNTDIPLEDF